METERGKERSLRILVTGAGGFLGRALVAYLASDGGHHLVAPSSKEADLLDPRALEPYGRIRFDRIFHLASWTQAGDFCLSHPGEQWLINQQINTTVLRFWAERQPQAKLVSIGTSCSYEEGRDLKEENYLEGTPIRDLYTYAMTKRMLYIGQRSLSEQYGLKYLTVVPSTLYGPDYPAGKKQMHFIFDIAAKILRVRRDGGEAVLWGDGLQRREICHVDDFVREMLALDTLVENDLVNIGAGEDHSIREFARILCELAGVDPARVVYDKTRYVGARAKCLNIGKLKGLLPGLARIPMRDGLADMLTALGRNQAFSS